MHLFQRIYRYAKHYNQYGLLSLQKTDHDNFFNFVVLVWFVVGLPFQFAFLFRLSQRRIMSNRVGNLLIVVNSLYLCNKPFYVCLKHL